MTEPARALPVLLLTALLAASVAAAQQEQPGRARPGGLREGQTAPDFALPLLKEKTDADGNKVNVIADEKVRLSSFRGKKAVCLFFSSYT